MAERDGKGRPTEISGLKDFLVLGVRALASGLVAALTLSFAALVLAHNAQAAGKPKPSVDASDAPRLVYAVDPVVTAAAAPAFRDTIVVSAQRGNEPWSAAPAPTGPKRPDDAGALWAKSRSAQADTATLLFLLGLFALGAASIVAAIGHNARGTRT